VKHCVMKIHIPYVMYKVDTHVIMIRVTVMRTGNVYHPRWSTKYTVAF